jgi:hypothetical protein
MENSVPHQAIWRALTTVNAPLPLPIDAETLLSCLRLENRDRVWRPHVRAFFREVGLNIIVDLVLEGAVDFDRLAQALRFWDADEDGENARWIREMAAVPMAEVDGSDAAGLRLRHA